MAIQQLIDSLNELNEAHLSMLKWGESKKEAIMANDIETLISIMNQESKLMKQISALEEKRLAACQAFLQEKGIKSMLQLNITELTRLVFDPAEKEALKNMQSALSWTLHELKRLNDLNQKLIEQSLAFVNYSVELLGAPPEQEATYKPPTDKPSGFKGPGYFDARA
ncbi:flagellar protein FlgN [Paenibacillus vini]|uniref:Flagellar biosynthesis protein FlgN n=1 Tax=Paenibacillus vini TaxID=1476024 RepID=A0ABQ4M6G8_9BACL|nr:flagellar protein FlgN [Paenibacillus vini]MDN4066432.1 flagellar protein FlgN [Paenibacillus vini]GIP51598.1 hypothetical protein J42TS3_06330 [Paenibacillus vini]